MSSHTKFGLNIKTCCKDFPLTFKKNGEGKKNNPYSNKRELAHLCICIIIKISYNSPIFPLLGAFLFFTFSSDIV